MNEKEKLLQDLARMYTEEYGKALKKEHVLLEQNGDVYPTQNLERRVMETVYPQKRTWHNYFRTIAAVAAVLVLVIVGIQMLHTTSTPDFSATVPSPVHFEVIPLSFSVPEGFTNTGFEQDNEKSIYYFEDYRNDNVVLVMEKSEQKPDPAGRTLIDINGSTAYAAREEGYSLLTFSKNGVLYELTCRYDINTLTRLGYEIL